MQQTSIHSSTHQRSSTRIIWSVKAEHLCSQIDQLFSSDVHGICIESFISYQQETLDFLKQYKNRYRQNQKAMPALMLSLSAAQSEYVTYVDRAEALLCQHRVWVFSDQRPPTEKEALQAKTEQAVIIRISGDLPSTFLKPKDSLYFGYGHCVLEIQKIEKHKLIGIVQHGGTIQQGMSLYLPQGEDFYTKDIAEFQSQVWIDAGVNYLLLPGCFSVERICEFRKALPRDDECSPWLLYQIDSQEALERYPQMEEWVDGAVISRRELSLTANPDLIPILTKELLTQCRDKAKLAIVASQMLGSMQYNITPTRAEVSDIAGAVSDGADAVMLSDITLQGPYALDAAQMAYKIIRDVEAHVPRFQLPRTTPSQFTDLEMDVICAQAVATASHIQAKALVCITKTGNTAIRISSLDTHLPIVAITFHDRICRKLRLLRGVDGMVLKADPQLDEVLPRINELLKTTGWLQKGDSIVFVTVTLSSMSRESSNLLTIQSIY